MQRTKCDLCAEPAVYHDTRVEAAGVVKRHLCRVHGQREWENALPKVKPLTEDEQRSMLGAVRHSFGDIDRPRWA